MILEEAGTKRTLKKMFGTFSVSLSNILVTDFGVLSWVQNMISAKKGANWIRNHVPVLSRDFRTMVHPTRKIPEVSGIRTK